MTLQARRANLAQVAVALTIIVMVAGLFSPSYELCHFG